jgi:hypothetical protein
MHYEAGAKMFYPLSNLNKIGIGLGLGYSHESMPEGEYYFDYAWSGYYYTDTYSSLQMAVLTIYRLGSERFYGEVALNVSIPFTSTRRIAFPNEPYKESLETRVGTSLDMKARLGPVGLRYAFLMGSDTGTNTLIGATGYFAINETMEMNVDLPFRMYITEFGLWNFMAGLCIGLTYSF